MVPIIFSPVWRTGSVFKRASSSESAGRGRLSWFEGRIEEGDSARVCGQHPVRCGAQFDGLCIGRSSAAVPLYCHRPLRLIGVGIRGQLHRLRMRGLRVGVLLGAQCQRTAAINFHKLHYFLLACCCGLNTACNVLASVIPSAH